MNRLVSRMAVFTSAMAIAVSVAPSTSHAQEGPARSEEVDDSAISAGALSTAEDVLDRYALTTAEGVETFLRDQGLSDAAVQTFARNQFGIDAAEFYDVAAGNFRRNLDEPSEPPVEIEGSSIHYNSGLSAAMEFERTRTWQQAGTRLDDGCRFEGFSSRVDASGAHGVAEVVDVDTESCVRTIFEGEYDPADNLRALDYDPGNAPQYLDCAEETEPPTLYQPGYDWVAGEVRFYFKEAFIDPVCISITSTTQNIRYRNAADSDVNLTILPGTTANTYYFDQLGEGWPDEDKVVFQQPGRNQSVTGSGFLVESLLQHRRVETNFPQNLLLVATAGGIAAFITVVLACQNDFQDTTFESYQSLLPERPSTVNIEGTTDGAGGCISLVNHRWWWGSGSYAR